jgi:hypothetical protein
MRRTRYLLLFAALPLLCACGSVRAVRNADPGRLRAIEEVRLPPLSFEGASVNGVAITNFLAGRRMSVARWTELTGKWSGGLAGALVAGLSNAIRVTLVPEIPYLEPPARTNAAATNAVSTNAAPRPRLAPGPPVLLCEVLSIREGRHSRWRNVAGRTLIRVRLVEADEAGMELLVLRAAWGTEPAVGRGLVKVPVYPTLEAMVGEDVKAIGREVAAAVVRERAP